MGKNSATLEGGEVLTFDYAVVATGSTNAAGAYAQPQCLQLAGRKPELQATAEQVMRRGG